MSEAIKCYLQGMVCDLEWAIKNASAISDTVDDKELASLEAHIIRALDTVQALRRRYMP